MENIKFSPRETHRIKVQFPHGGVADAELVSFTKYASETIAGSTCLELELGGADRFYAESHNYFDALVSLRNQLEPLGVKVLCFGARVDVWASGMQRDMGAGLSAYLLSADVEGCEPEQSIFDYAPPAMIGTVSKQTEHFENWRNQRQSQKS